MKSKKKYVVTDIRSILERAKDDLINHANGYDEILEILVNEISGQFEDIFEILNDIIEVESNE